MNLKIEKAVEKYKFQADYFTSPEDLKHKIINKSIIPHQVEFQPGPQGRKICWLSCPYCYGESAIDSGERLSEQRLVEIVNEVADGGVKKVTFAGWATDPLNSKHIDSMLEAAIGRNLIFGFNTKALKVSKRFIEILSNKNIQSESWISLSVDAGTNKTFNVVHGLIESKVPLYDRLLENVKNINKNNFPKRKFDVSAAYLVNIFNINEEDILNFINDFKKAGCNILRFAFAQPPRGKIDKNEQTVPTEKEINNYVKILKGMVKNKDTDDFKILISTADQDNDLFRKPRTLPCVARFVYPTVGFDGHLYQCSQSAAANFKEMELGDLKNKNFWDLYYNYDVSDFEKFFRDGGDLMNKLGCRCDRKEHIVNKKIKSSKLFS
tara:strand:- start:488 stop:1627 length:1140 start_codon:yes stop_codon:yes gene_type:complete